MEDVLIFIIAIPNSNSNIVNWFVFHRVDLLKVYALDS